MMNYSIEDAINIINSCDESFNPNTRHFNVRNVQRIGNLELIYKTFLHNPLMSIIKQDFNYYFFLFRSMFVIVFLFIDLKICIY